MTTRRTGWIVGALAVALVLSMLAPGAVLVLAVPVAVVGSILTRRRPRGHGDRDVADRLLAAAATFTGEPTSSDGEQGDWAAALRAELATITVPRERRRFAVGAAVALRRFARRAGRRRTRVGDHAPSAGDAVRGWPPVRPLHAVAAFWAETGVVAAVTTLVAVAVAYGVEAAHWYHLAPDVSVLDGEHVAFDSARAAVLGAVHPVILGPPRVLVALAGLGRLGGVRTPRAATG